MSIATGYSYSVGSGGIVYAGVVAPAGPPSWLSGLSTNTWTLLPGQPLTPWATSTGSIASSGYLGSNPIASIMSAFTSPAYDYEGMVAYLYGGGHNDGSYNGWIKYDIRTGQHSVAIQPTPPSKYPPSFVTPNTLIAYPSGATDRGYVFLDNLTDPTDVQYNAPVRAPLAFHAYGQLTYRVSPSSGPTLSMLYGPVADASLTTGNYTYVSSWTYATQLGAIGLNEAFIDHDTFAHHDEVTGLCFLTLTPGDSGGGVRNHIAVINPETHTIVSVHPVEFSLGNYPSFCAFGRKVLAFGSNTNQNKIVAFDMDTRTLSYYTVGGAAITAAPFLPVVCAWGGGNTVYRWNWSVELNSIYTLDMTPTGGAGTFASPYTVLHTKRTLSGMSVTPNYQYKLYYNRAHNFFVIPHSSTTGWYALKLS